MPMVLHHISRIIAHQNISAASRIFLYLPLKSSAELLFAASISWFVLIFILLGCPLWLEAIFGAVIKRLRKVGNQSFAERRKRRQTHRHCVVWHSIRRHEPEIIVCVPAGRTNTAAVVVVWPGPLSQWLQPQACCMPEDWKVWSLIKDDVQPDLDETKNDH